MFVKLPDNTKIYYNVNGQEQAVDATRPVLIVLHGGPGIADHTLYLPFWLKLKNMLQVVFIDMRGHGRSDSRNDFDHWNLEQWGRDVYDFCQALAIQKPIVAGISFGGWVTLAYASQYPDHARGLLLCHTEAKIEPEIRKQAYVRKAQLLKKDSHKIAAVIDDIFKWNSGEESRQLYFNYCLPLYSSRPYEKKLFERCIANPIVWNVFGARQHQFNFIPVLHKIKTPALVMTGELDPEHPPEFAKTLANELPGANLKIIADAGVPAYQDQELDVLEVLTKQIQSWL